jgi:hypothetical protein
VKTQCVIVRPYFSVRPFLAFNGGSPEDAGPEIVATVRQRAATVLRERLKALQNG